VDDLLAVHTKKESRKMLGDRIRQLRLENNLTQTQFASLFGLYDSTISQYENGKRVPEYDIIIKIANKFNVSVDWLLGRVDSRELVIMDTDSLPQQLKDIGVEYLMLAKEIKDKGFPPEDVRKILHAINLIKNKR